MKNTPLIDEHRKLGAKLVDFAGWLMPVQYEGILQEHKSVRESVGVFDVSHMGEFFVHGKDVVEFLNSVVPQDIEALYVGKAIYCQLTNENAGIVDDLLIYRLDDKEFLLIVNAARAGEDLAWLNSLKGKLDVIVEDRSGEYTLLAIQGPNAVKVLNKAGFCDDLAFMHIAQTELYNADVFISRSGYTGEDGFEILVKNKYASLIWYKLLEDGAEFNIKPIGLGARDTLRLEAALLLYGHDMDENTTPLEAGLKWSIAKDKKADYIGKQRLIEQLNNGVSKKLIGFKLIDRGIAREGSKIFIGEKESGVVTSGGFLPIDKKGFGLGYINDISIKLGDTIFVDVRGKKIEAQVAKRPFINKSYVK